MTDHPKDDHKKITGELPAHDAPHSDEHHEGEHHEGEHHEGEHHEGEHHEGEHHEGEHHEGEHHGAEHGHGHGHDLDYTKKENLIMRDQLGFKYHDKNHKRKLSEIGIEKWNDYVKKINEIFRRYNENFDSIIDAINKSRGEGKSSAKNEQFLQNIAQEAVDKGWSNFKITVLENGKPKEIRLYEFGLKGLEGLKKTLSENAAAVEAINKFLKIKKAALEHAVKATVADVLKVYGWREPTAEELLHTKPIKEQVEALKKQAAHDKKDWVEPSIFDKAQLEPYADRVAKEKHGSLTAEIREAAAAMGVAERDINRVLDEENLVATLRAEGISDKSKEISDAVIRQHALEKLAALKEKNANVFLRIKNYVADALNTVPADSLDATRAAMKGISVEEVKYLANLAHEFQTNPTIDLAKVVSLGASAEAAKWLTKESFLTNKGELIKDDKLSPKAKAYKSLFDDFGISFKDFAKKLPNSTKIETGKEAVEKAFELDKKILSSLDDIATLLRTKVPYKLRRAMLQTPAEWMLCLTDKYQHVSEYGKSPQEIAIKKYLHSIGTNFTELAKEAPPAQDIVEIQQAYAIANTDKSPENEDVIKKLVNYLAGKRDSINLKPLQAALENTKTSPELSAYVQKIISPPAKTEITKIERPATPARVDIARPLDYTPPPVKVIEVDKSIGRREIFGKMYEVGDKIEFIEPHEPPFRDRRTGLKRSFASGEIKGFRKAPNSEATSVVIMRDDGELLELNEIKLFQATTKEKWPRFILDAYTRKEKHPDDYATNTAYQKYAQYRDFMVEHVNTLKLIPFTPEEIRKILGDIGKDFEFSEYERIEDDAKLVQFWRDLLSHFEEEATPLPDGTMPERFYGGLTKDEWHNLVTKKIETHREVVLGADIDELVAEGLTDAVDSEETTPTPPIETTIDITTDPDILEALEEVRASEPPPEEAKTQDVDIEFAEPVVANTPPPPPKPPRPPRPKKPRQPRQPKRPESTPPPPTPDDDDDDDAALADFFTNTTNKTNESAPSPSKTPDSAPAEKLSPDKILDFLSTHNIAINAGMTPDAITATLRKYESILNATGAPTTADIMANLPTSEQYQAKQAEILLSTTLREIPKNLHVDTALARLARDAKAASKAISLLITAPDQTKATALADQFQAKIKAIQEWVRRKQTELAQTEFKKALESFNGALAQEFFDSKPKKEAYALVTKALENADQGKDADREVLTLLVRALTTNEKVDKDDLYEYAGEMDEITPALAKTILDSQF